MNAPFGGAIFRDYLLLASFSPAVPAGLFIIRKAFPFLCISFFCQFEKKLYFCNVKHHEARKGKGWATKKRWICNRKK